jgi:hypothetical protein
VLTDLDGETRIKDGDGDGTATVDMGAYEAEGYYQLTVTKAGTGDGQVTSTPDGINCGYSCSEFFLENSSITLVASPDGNSTFTGWSGACSGFGNCMVTMDTPKSVTATIELKQQILVYLPLVFNETVPPTCYDSPIKNGGFEANCGWTLAGRIKPEYTNEKSHADLRSMQTGIPSGNVNGDPGYSEVYQDIIVPTGDPKLSFWLYTQSSQYPISDSMYDLEISEDEIQAGEVWYTYRTEMRTMGVESFLSSPSKDTQYVYLLDPDGTTIKRLIWWQSSDSQMWEEYVIDLSPYGGQLVRLLFGVYNDGVYGVTSTYIDEVSIR